VKYKPESTRNDPMLGTQDVYAFDNGYGASVIRGRYSYGGPKLFELAVLKNDNLCYDTEITNDVIGHLTRAEVQKLLAQIASLEAPGE